MREGFKRQERETTGGHLAAAAAVRHAPVARWCVGAVICWLTFGDYPSQADDFQHELAAARLIEVSVLAQKPGQNGAADRQRVARIFEQLVTRYPKNPDAHSAYAECLMDMGATGTALGQWRIAETLDPANAATASHLGGCYLAEGESREAVEFLAKAVRLEPRNALYHFELANAAFILRHIMPGADGAREKGVLQGALAEYKKAAELDPFNTEYARAYAETFYGMEQPDWRDALKAWTHFLELKGPPDFCYTNLARVNLKLGRKNDALEDLDKVTRPDFQGVKEHLTKQAEAAASPGP